MLSTIVSSLGIQAPPPKAPEALPPIVELHNALTAFQKERSPTNTERLKKALSHVLVEKDYSKHFKNAGWIGGWGAYLVDLKDLQTSLIGKGSVDDQVLKAASELVQKEVEKQKTYGQVIQETVASAVREAVSNIATSAISAVATPAPKELPKHPLEKLEALIDHFESKPEETLKASQNQQLKECLEELEKRPFFKGVSRYIRSQLEGKPLSDSIGSLHDLLVQYVWFKDITTNSTPSNSSEVPDYVCKEVRHIERYYATVAKHVKPYISSHGSNREIVNAFLDNSTKDIEASKALLRAAIEFDEIEELRPLFKNAFPFRVPTNLSMLNKALPNALLLFRKSPEQVVDDKKINEAKERLQGWLEYAASQVPAVNKKLQDELNECLLMLNEGRYVESLDKFQKVVETLIVTSTTKEEKQAEITQTHKALAIATQTLDAFGKVKEPSVTQKDINFEKEALVENLAMFSTFMSVTAICPNDPNYPKEAAFDNIMKSFADVTNPAMRKELFQERLYEWIGRVSGGLGWARKLWASFFFNQVALPLFSSVTKEVLEFVKKTIYSPVNTPLASSPFKLVTRVTNAVAAYNQASNEFGNYKGTRDKEVFLEETLRGKHFNNGREHTELLNKVTEVAIDKFVNLPRPIRWVAKKALTWFDVPSMGLQTMIDRMYKESHYVNVIDGTILEQLEEVEKMLDEMETQASNEGSNPEIHESAQGQKKFEQLVDHLFIMFERRRYNTPSEMKSSREEGHTYLEGAKREIKGMAKENLRGAMVQMMTFAYQMVMKENMIRMLSHKTMHKLNDTLFPHSKLEELFTKDELEEIAKQKPGAKSDVRTLTELDLKKAYATRKKLGDHNAVTQQMIDTDLHDKYKKTEIDLKKMVTRFIERGQRMAKKFAGDFLETPEQVALSYIDWLRTSGSGIAAKVESFIKEIHGEQDQKKQAKKVAKLKETLLCWTKELETHMGKIAAKVGGSHSSDAHLLYLHQLTKSSIMPHLAQFNQAAKDCLEGKASDLLEIARVITNAIDEESRQLDVRTTTQKERTVSLGERITAMGTQAVQAITPAVINGVTAVAKPPIERVADEVLNIAKDPVLLETAIRHGLLLFVEEQEGKRPTL